MTTTSLTASTPLLLLPVRIETRFVDNADQGGLLLVRIFPDTISCSSFEPELTNDEIAAGKAYWDLLWSVGKSASTEDLHGPWRAIASTFQPQRAAWIVKQMTPSNLPLIPAAPTASGITPAPAPVYPSPPTRSSSWEKPPSTMALPDAWTVLLYTDTSMQSYTGSPIVSNLAVSLTPNDGVMPDGLPVDTAMQWLVDFDEAVKVGMGLSIPLDETTRAIGFKQIIVLGVRDKHAAASGEAEFATLLDAHHYTDGLAFIQQGSPTNNTADASSAFSRKDPNYDRSFAVECLGPLTSNAITDGPLTAAAMGLPLNIFDHVQNADSAGVRNGHDMLTALWPSTLGYFMDQMMSPVFDAEILDRARSFALANAVPRGALPALSTGNSPYGILPVTSLAAYPANDQQFLRGINPEGALARFMKSLLPSWQKGIAAAPHVGGTNDPDTDLMQVLGMDASSMTFRGRPVLGDEVFWNLMLFFKLPQASITEWWKEHLVRGRALLNSLGLTSWDPRVIQTSIGREGYLIPFYTVQDGPLSETDALKNDATVGGIPMNYIKWLRTASFTDIQNENYPGTKPTSLLYRMLRLSVLREYFTLSATAQVNEGLLSASVFREVELVNVRQAAPSATPWDVVAQPITSGSSINWGQYLHDLNPPPESQFARWADLRAALDDLANLPTAELDRLLTETLDACSHRIDVWVTAVADSILQRQRASQPSQQTTKLHLGAYAWVENVKPATKSAAVTGTDSVGVAKLQQARLRQFPTAQKFLSQPVLNPQTDNGGFIHAPSMTQAAAGAVLRNGYMTHRGTPDEGLLDIDLSSERTQAALTILDGVRQGLGLSELTGYQFEQGLHDAGLDVYIQPFRDRYLAIGAILTVASVGGDDEPSMVVDGLKLLAAWKAGAFPGGGSWGAGLPSASPPENATQQTVLNLLVELDDVMDALADLSLSESVYQIMRGNFGRAGGMLDAISRGEHPPQPDIVTTPRSSIDITHRLMLLFAETLSLPPAWAGVSASPRALAEPSLNSWVAGCLPDPATVRCVVSYQQAGSQHKQQVSLRDLDVGPLDVLRLASAVDQPQGSELEQRIVYQASPPAGATTITITYAASALPPNSVSFPDLLFVSRLLRDMLGSARPLEAQSFSLPEANASHHGGAPDLGEINTRLSTLLAKLASDLDSLNSALLNVTTVPQAVRDALAAASAYGIFGSVPQRNDTVADLTAQAQLVAAELQSRQTSASAVPLPVTSVADAVVITSTILGKDAVVLPRFTPPDLANLHNAFAESAAMRAVDPQAIDRWLLQLSHIREGCMRFDFAAAAVSLLNDEPRPELTLAQLPFTTGDRWVGLPIDPTSPPVTGRVALEAVTTGNPATHNSFSGMMLDEWLDRIPRPVESAGLAFHFEEPKARAPKTLLLAVCPDGRATWDTGLIQAILEETLELAKIRAVDLDSVQEVGQILPALYVPQNLQGATIATNLFAKEVINVTRKFSG